MEMEALRPWPGCASRLCAWGLDLADQSLHTTARQAPPDSYIRLDTPGPAAIGTGPGRSKQSDADRSGMERV
jgi:hypothetical protein